MKISRKIVAGEGRIEAMGGPVQGRKLGALGPYPYPSQPFREDFQMRRELRREIQPPCRRVLRQHTDPELGGARFPGKVFRPLEQPAADPLFPVRRQHGEIGDQTVGAGGIVQVGERLVRENGHEPDDRPGQLRDEDASNRLAAASVHAFAVRIGHRLARPQSGIDRALELLQRDDAPPQGSRIGNTILADRRLHGIAY